MSKKPPDTRAGYVVKKRRCEVRHSGKRCRRDAAFEHVLRSGDKSTGIELVHCLDVCVKCSPLLDAHAAKVNLALKRLK